MVVRKCNKIHDVSLSCLEGSCEPQWCYRPRRSSHSQPCVLCCRPQVQFHLQQAAYRGQAATTIYRPPAPDRSTSDPRNPCNPKSVTVE